MTQENYITKLFVSGAPDVNPDQQNEIIRIHFQVNFSFHIKEVTNCNLTLLKDGIRQLDQSLTYRKLFSLISFKRK